MLEGDLGQLEHERAGEMGLFGLTLRTEEQTGLAVMVGEALGPQANLLLFDGDGGGAEAALRILARPALLAGLARLLGS